MECVYVLGSGLGGVKGLGLGFTNPGGTGESGICVCFGCSSVGGVRGGECMAGLDYGLGRWGGVKSVFVVSLDYLY